MISATCWVPRGAAAENPLKADLDEAEIARISALAKMELNEAEEDLEEAKGSQANPPSVQKSIADDDDLKEYNMADYDKELEEDEQNTIAGVQGLSYYAPDEEDDYLTLPTAQDAEEEKEELRIYKSDNMVLAAKTEDDLSLLEVHVYDDQDMSLYVHHDILLPSFPLCLEWLPITPGTGDLKPGNFVAIGTFEPEIELWDLDTVDGMYPAAILGKSDRPEAKALGTGKKKRKMKQANDSYHVDAILALASNPNHSNLLASGSADTTIKLWDLQTGSSEKAAQSFSGYHKGKISSLAWNPVESTVLLSGGYDKTARVGDMRSANIQKDSRAFSISGDVENTQWDHNGVNFYVGSDNGHIYKFDARGTSDKPVWMLQAHDTEITSFSVNKFIDNLLVTSSSDHQVKLWNLSNDKPSMLLSRDFDVGKVFSVNWGPEQETRSLLSVAGSEGSLKVWDAFSNRVVRGAFGGPQHKEHPGERLAVANDDDSEESEDEQEVEDIEENMDEE